jgi:N-acetylglucosamine kinase-like BadF-type ATPase
VLERLVPAHFGFGTPLELARSMHDGHLAQRRALELAPIVMAAAAFDEVARSIVERLVSEVVAFARAAASRLRLHVAEVLVGGGLMRSADDAVVAQIAAGLPAGLTVRRTTAPPIVGAALLALDTFSVESTVQRRAREQLIDAVERAETATSR